MRPAARPQPAPAVASGGASGVAFGGADERSGPPGGAGVGVGAGDARRRRARDFAEIQERMLVPLYRAVLDRADAGPATSVLALGCRSGLALLLAAGRGAQAAGVEGDPELRALARQRGLRVLPGLAGLAQGAAGPPRHGLVTLLDGLAETPEPERLAGAAARLTARGGLVALAAWGPRERCDSAGVLGVRGVREGPGDPFALSGAGALERVAAAAGLRVAGGGRVACPFAYPDLDSAVRGLLATGLYDAAVACHGERLVAKELTEALFPFRVADGAVRMQNVFRYVLAERA